MYAPVSAMRSTRFPLAGLGCGCSTPTSGLGSMSEAKAAYLRAEAQRCLQFGNKGACLARVARRTPVTITPGFAGLGQILSTLGGAAAGVAVAGAGATGFILGYFLGKHAQKRGLALNSRRRRGRR